MPLLQWPTALRRAGRLRRILGTLSRHGLWAWLSELRSGGPGEPDAVWAVRAAAALQELGPTFVKLGQFLSARPDLLPAAFSAEFRKLQDHVAPSDRDAVAAAVAAELGGPVKEVFASFEPDPFAAGSVAQVHRAVTRDGEPVVVKVRRPGIEAGMELDLLLLTYLAGHLEAHVAASRPLRPTLLVEEFRRAVRHEFDLLAEASAAERFAAAFAGRSELVVPRVRWDLTTGGVLTMARLDGVNILSAPLSVPDRRRLAGQLLDVFLHQIFVLGMFHADPHPGNLMVLAGGKLALLDFGLVGRLDARLRERLVGALSAAAARDLDLLLEMLAELDAVGDGADPEELKLDLAALLDKYHGLPARRFRLDALFAEFTELARRHRLAVPRELLLVGKAMVTVGGVVAALCPDMGPAEMIRSRIAGLVAGQVTTEHLARRGMLSLWQLGDLLRSGPAGARRLFRKLLRGELRFGFRHEGLAEFNRELGRTANRLAFSVLVAAMFLGSSIIIHSRMGPDWMGIPLLGLAGYLMAGFAALWLVVAIFRSGRMS